MTTERTSTRLPTPQMLALVKMNEMEVAELIERHIDYIDPEGRSVHLPISFVRHFMQRDDGLPRVYGFSQLPIMLPDGALVSGSGLNRKYGIIFRVPAELDALLPAQNVGTTKDVAAAMRFLTDEWLVDVAADYAGKCTIIALCLTVIERMLLPERPAFFVTAGRRGSGKTTTLQMVSQGVLGHTAAAAAWSPNDEERRKALLAYLESGLPLLIWDNLKRGTAISCASIEKALTTEIYADRILGVSEIRRVPAYTVQCFTGNNIAPTGDLASRNLNIRLGADRPDPENRTFVHTDPISWTLKHRGRILQEMFTILLGNPRRRPGRHPAAETRFKDWWDIIGSAIEHAAGLAVDYVEGLVAEPHPTCPPARVRFKELFLQNEDDDEQSAGLAAVLSALMMRFQGSWFQGADVAGVLSQGDDTAITLKANLEAAAARAITTISAPAVTARLKAVADAPIRIDKQTLVLRYQPPNVGRRDGGFRVTLLA